MFSLGWRNKNSVHHGNGETFYFIWNCSRLSGPVFASVLFMQKIPRWMKYECFTTAYEIFKGYWTFCAERLWFFARIFFCVSMECFVSSLHFARFLSVFFFCVWKICNIFNGMFSIILQVKNKFLVIHFGLSFSTLNENLLGLKVAQSFSKNVTTFTVDTAISINK